MDPSLTKSCKQPRITNQNRRLRNWTNPYQPGDEVYIRYHNLEKAGWKGKEQDLRSLGPGPFKVQSLAGTYGCRLEIPGAPATIPSTMHVALLWPADTTSGTWSLTVNRAPAIPMLQYNGQPFNSAHVSEVLLTYWCDNSFFLLVRWNYRKRDSAIPFSTIGIENLQRSVASGLPQISIFDQPCQPPRHPAEIPAAEGECPFSDLPRELRDMIYNFSLVSPEPIKLHGPLMFGPSRQYPSLIRDWRDCWSRPPFCMHNKFLGNLMRVNKTVGEEARAVFYQKNVFSMKTETFICQFLPRIGVENSRHLRRVRLPDFIPPGIPSLPAQWKLQPESLQNLQELHVGRPHHARGRTHISGRPIHVSNAGSSVLSRASEWMEAVTQASDGDVAVAVDRVKLICDGRELSIETCTCASDFRAKLQEAFERQRLS